MESPSSDLAARGTRDLRFPLLLACFALSGFAALLYETVWTRQLSFVFGTSELAVSAVLAAYMGGLALGASLAGRLAHRVTRPVLTYGILELAIAVGALAVPAAVALARNLYLGSLGDLPTAAEGTPWLVHVFQLASSFLVLAPCTLAMGATLPLLAKHAVHADAQLGPRIGLLYASNTAGAIGGTLTAAFLLIPELGLRGTVYVGAVVNVAVFVAAAALAPRVRQAAAATARSVAPRLSLHWVLPLMTLSGAVSFVYEVLWFRMLGWILGGSIAAFATMLASFLCGIFIGSAAASRFATSRGAALIGLAVAELATALFAWAAYASSASIVSLADSFGASPSRLAPGALVAAAALLPMTVSIGATFPFAVRIFARGADDASEASARVYGWNTMGSIIGSIGAGFVLLPALGYEGTLVVGVAANLVLATAVALALPGSRLRFPLAAAAAAAGVAVVVAPPGPPLRLVASNPLGSGMLSGELVQLRVGRSATVTVFEEPGHLKMYTNGLPESGAPTLQRPDRRRLAALLSKLPVVFHPNAADALVIGLGAGITVSAVPPIVERVDVIELEEEVVEANRHMRDRADDDPLADPRVNLRIGDARGHLVLAKKRYDVIVSQPSHPWTAGASHLYTREFFALVQQRLAENGIFAQWIGLPFVDTTTLPRLIATLRAVFPYVEVFQPMPSGLVFLGRNIPFDDSTVEQALTRMRETYATEAIHRLEDVIAIRTLRNEGVRALTQGVDPITDDDNPFATTRRPMRSAVKWFGGLMAPYDCLQTDARLGGSGAGLDTSRVFRQALFHGVPSRVRRLTPHLAPLPKELAEAWVSFHAGAMPSALAAFERAHSIDPNDESTLTGLVLTGSDAVELDGLSTPLRTLADAREAERQRDWQRLRELDAALAAFTTRDLAFPEAATWRLMWRQRLDAPAHAAMIFELSGVIFRETMQSRWLLARAEAAFELDDPRGALAAIKDFSDQPRGAMRDRLMRARVRILVRQLPEELHRASMMKKLGLNARPSGA